MERQKHGNGQGTRGADCLRFEDLEQHWESLADEEILWCADHIRSCALGIHTAEGDQLLSHMEPLELLARLRSAEVEALLTEAGAIERDQSDYEIHPGLHSDVHINA